MVVWRGYGWWTVMILWACLYFVPGFIHLRQGQTWAQATRPTVYGTPFVAGLLLAGVILIALGIYLNRGPLRKMIEPKTGRTYMGRPTHTLYYLNMEYWGVAAFIGGIIMWVKSR